MAAPAEPPAATRREQDSLGPIDVPAAALYGARTARALQNLSFSGRTLGGCPAYLRTLAQVKMAAARANADAGVIGRDVAEAIEQAAVRVAAGESAEHFPADLLGGGGSIGVHVNLNEVIANLANEMRGRRRGEYAPVRIADVGASQSTADVCHTALRVAVLDRWRPLAAELQATVATLCAQAKRFAGVETIARTCLRDAMPVTLDLLFGSYATLIERRADELRRAVEALRAVSLGGTVVGTGSGAPPGYRDRVVPLLGQVTGLALTPCAARADALQNSDDIASVSAQLRLLADALIKIAGDLRLLSSGPRAGFGEIELPQVQEGSTFFASKSNPVVPETVMQCAFQVLGCDRAVQAANEHAELYLNVFDGLAAANVLDALAMLAGAVRLLESRCLRQIEANTERCAELAGFARQR
jgi:aspartate ammonia-lyase